MIDDVTMPVSNAAADRPLWNVPNQLTVARLMLAIVCFIFLALHFYRTALCLFVVAAGTDWVDGYWARRYGQITQLGRVLDPFADKIVICGTFIFLAAEAESKIAPWMAVVVVARELLVTAIRSFFEERGVDFSAKASGKWKMVLQCAAAAASIYLLSQLEVAAATSPPPWLPRLVAVLVWGAIVLTVYSGWEYVRNALAMVRPSRNG
jgi:CDP-diacylglycerol--glycerol-3-phosphate 3-phosphatidyltransferase